MTDEATADSSTGDSLPASKTPFRRFAPSIELPPTQTDSDTFRFVFSNEKPARDNFIVLNRAIQHENYDRNNIVLWAHDDMQPPIGRGTNIDTSGKNCTLDITFVPRDILPFAGTIRDLVAGQWLRAVSLSWLPITYKRSSDPDVEAIFTEVDMLEVSVTPLPALPDALQEARRSGVNTQPLYEWAEKLLDTGGQILVPRNELETLRRAARMPAASKTTQDPASAVESILAAKHKRALARAPKVPVFKRGLYDLSQLCYLVASLGYCHDSAEYEADLEQDESPVPGMLGEALVTLGEALKAMAVEEVDELLEAHVDEDEGTEIETRALSAEQRSHIAAGKTPRARAWRLGIAVSRAGKSLSKSNQEKLGDTQDHQDRAMTHHKALGEHHDAVGEHMQEAQDHHERTTQTLEQIGVHLRAIQDPAEAEDQDSNIDEAVKFHRAATGHLEKVGTAHEDMADRHADVGDSHRALGRCVKSAQRCVRSVLAGAVQTDTDEPSAATDDKGAAKAEKARKAREARAVRARELAQQHREPITLD